MSATSHITSAAHRNRQSAFQILRAVAVKCGRLLLMASNAHAEARLHRAMIKAELYRNRYRHASKNDDELPIVKPGEVS